MNPHDLFTSDDLAWLEGLDAHVESTWIERKERIEARRLAEQISGFANGQPPGGLIVIGVSSDGRLIGVKQNWSDDLVRRLDGLVEGRARDAWKYRFVPIRDGQERLLYVYVPVSGQRVLCLSDGDAFQRVGTSNNKLSSAEIADLRDARGEKPVELMPAIPYSADLLEAEVSEQFLAGVIARNNISLPIDLYQALRNKKLLVSSAQGESLILAAVVALAKAPHDVVPGARLRFLRFEGVEEKVGAERNVIRDRWFEGAISKIVEDFRGFMRTQVRELEYLGSDGKFVRENEYPEAAWQEAVVNALVHRSYALANVATFVRMFDDRLEVESPGGFPGTNRPDLEGMFNHSSPRNPVLAGVLQYLRLVWMAREGTRRMHDTMKDMGLPVPEFDEPGGVKVVVTLRNDLARRRARQSTRGTREQWADVEEHLTQDLAYFQNLALQEWTVLTRDNAIPPEEALRIAERRLHDGGVSIEVKEALLDRLASLPNDVLKPLVVRLTPEVLSGLFRGAPSLVARAVGQIAKYDETVEVVLTSLERVPVGYQSSTSEQQFLDQCLSVIGGRLYRRPVPSREWVDRVVAVLRHIPGRVSADLYKQLTGKALNGS